jgi:hypothetical protein
MKEGLRWEKPEMLQNFHGATSWKLVFWLTGETDGRIKLKHILINWTAQVKDCVQWLTLH